MPGECSGRGHDKMSGEKELWGTRALFLYMRAQINVTVDRAVGL